MARLAGPRQTRYTAPLNTKRTLVITMLEHTNPTIHALGPDVRRIRRDAEELVECLTCLAHNHVGHKSMKSQYGEG